MKKLAYFLLALVLVCSLSLSALAAETVEAQIRELPTVEEFQSMGAEEQLAAYNRTQSAYDAYMALSQEEKARIDGAETVFEALFSYFNDQIAYAQVPAEPEQSGHSPLIWGIAAVLAAIALVSVFRKRKAA